MATPASGHVEVSTSPGLRPGFRPGATDYVSRCVPGRPLEVAVHASGGDRVSVAGGPERGGTFVTGVQRRAGAGLSIRVRSPNGSTRHYYVRCLPQDFPGWTIERHGMPQAQWYVLTPIGSSGLVW